MNDRCQKSEVRGQMMPKRVQRKRTKGWRMPANTVYVGRGTKWGNPFQIGKDYWNFGEDRFKTVTQQDACDAYRMLLMTDWCTARLLFTVQAQRYKRRVPDIEKLRGKDLACWCPLDQPCHADVLLELANS